MNSTKLKALAVLAALPFFSVAQDLPYKGFADAANAADKAVRDKRFDEAVQIAAVAGRLAAKPGEVDRALDVQTRALEGKQDWAGLLKAAKPAVLACTNFTAGASARTLLARAAKAAISAKKDGDIAELVDALAKDRDITPAVFDSWNGLASLLSDSAKARGVPPEEAARMLRLAQKLLSETMPQDDLPPVLRYRRDARLLDIAGRLGDGDAADAAREAVKDFAFSFQPATQAETNSVKAAVETLFSSARNAKDWDAYAALAEELSRKRKEYLAVRHILGATNPLAQAKDWEGVLRFIPLARAAVRTPQEALQVADGETGALEGKGDWASLARASLEALEPITSFQKPGWEIRRLVSRAAKGALEAADYESVKRLLAILAREKEITEEVFALWISVTDAFIANAQNAAKKRPVAEAKTTTIGEGSTTFGLWQTAPVVINGRYAIDQLRLSEAENILRNELPQQGLDPILRARLDRIILAYEERVGGRQGQLAASATVRDYALRAKAVTPAETNAVNAAINAVLQFHKDRGEWHDYATFANDLVAARKDFLGPRVATFTGHALGAYIRGGDDANVRKASATLASFPLSGAAIEGYYAIRSLNPQADGTVLAFFQPLIERKAQMSDEQRARFDGTLWQIYKNVGDLPNAKACVQEIIDLSTARSKAVAEENRRFEEARAKGATYAKKALPAIGLNHGAILGAGEYCLAEKDVEGAVHFLGMYAGLNPNRPDARLKLAQIQLFARRNDDALATLGPLLTNATTKANLRFTAKVYASVAEAKDAKDFESRIRRLRGDSDAAGGEGETAFDADKRYFNWLRGASAQLFEALAEKDRIDYLLAMEKVTKELEHPEERLVYTAEFLADPPATADGAYRSGIFEKLPAERRFAPYAMYSSIDKEKEFALFKSKGPAPKLDDAEEGKEGQVVVAYGTRGVHLYIQLNDPDAGKARDGYDRGATIEVSVMPGEMTTFHWTMYSASDPVDHQEVEWDMPMEGHKLTRDYIRHDTASYETCHVLHTFIPWVMFYDRMPGNGDTWRFVLFASWAGQSRTLGGGSVHELGRGLQVKFDMPDDVRANVREGLLKAAVGEFHKIRDPWENAGFWADPSMGDEPFFKEVVKPFLDDVDAQAKFVVSGEMKPADADRLIQDGYLKKFIDFRLVLDKLRVEYLQKQLFAE